MRPAARVTSNGGGVIAAAPGEVVFIIAVEGSAKKTVGRVTGNRRLRAEGRGDQAKGNLKQAWAKVKDAVKH